MRKTHSWSNLVSRFQISAVGLPAPEDAFKTFYWSVFYGVPRWRWEMLDA